MTHFRRAIVIGGGIGGLAAAGALSSVTDHVTVVERDPLGSTTRPGVPQSRQLHNLLGRAQIELERCLPGFLRLLEDSGAGFASVADETHVHELGQWMPERPLGFRIVCAPRYRIEQVARAALSQRPNVSVVDGAEALALATDRTGAVVGVQVGTATGPATWPADLVVDATGATGPGSAWIEALAEEPVPMTETPQGRWFVSTVLRRPESCMGVPDFWMNFPSGAQTKSALLAPLSADRWLLSVSGLSGDRVPTTFPQVLEHVASTRDGRMLGRVGGAVPDSLPDPFYVRTHRRHLYERMSKFPKGVLPVGDTIANIDPLFGLGMSVAAWQCTALRDAIKEWDGANWNVLSHRYLQEAAKRCAAAQDIDDAVRRAVQHSTGGVESGVANLMQMIEVSESLHRIYVSTWHLLSSVDSLSEAITLHRN